MISVTKLCPRCGAEIPADAPEGGCPGCLLETGLGLPDTNYTNDHEDRAIETLRELGDYELLEEVGRGGQGVVYRARQKSLNRTVALKIISLGQWASQAHLKRFRREAEAAASLDHPSIVPIYEVGERQGSCYFSMKFVEGGQLDEVVKHEPMPIRRAVELIAKLARTVHYAHEHGILHRDIKPGNILLDQNGEPHLTDFGLARLLETESTITRTLEVMGTPSYMAPEQAAGETTKLNKATDIYGLGAVFYQLLTGHPPFAGGTSWETIRLLLDTEPRQPRLWNRKISRDLSTICLKCLEKDPQRRYSSALALAEDLEHWLKHEPIRAKRSGFLRHVGKWARREPAIAALIASLVALAAAIGWNVWKSELISRPETKGIAVLPFENLSPDPDNAIFAEGIHEEILSRFEMTQLRMENNHAEAVRLLQTRQAQFQFASQIDQGTNQVILAFAQRLAGDTAATKATAEQARDTLKPLCRDQPDNSFLAQQLALANAALGEKEMALSEAERATTLLPSATDPLSGPTREEVLALIQMMFGDSSHSISALSLLLQTPYISWLYGPMPATPAVLRLDPIWDPLRADPAFQKLCEETQK